MFRPGHQRQAHEIPRAPHLRHSRGHRRLRVFPAQEFADKHNVEVRREGGSKALRMYRPDGKWRTVVDFKTNSVPQGVRDRAFEEWEQIIIDNALLLNAD